MTAKSQWVSLNSGVTSDLNGIQFLNKDTGYAVGANQSVLKTINGGLTWNLKYSGSGYFYGLDFINDTGYVSGKNGSGPGQTSHVIKTTNAANNFANNIGYYISITLTSIDFINSQEGWTVGGYGSVPYVFHTVNGGSSWSTQTVTINNLLVTDVYFPVQDTGFVVFNSGHLEKTTNSGANWVSQNSGITSDLNSVFFVNSNIGYCVGQGGAIIKTINGGTTWTTQVSNTIENLESVFFINSQKGYAVGSNGTIIFTIDGGINWILQNSGVTNRLTCVHFADSLTGYISGTNGLILKTTNGGVLSIDENIDLTSTQIFPNPTSSKISVQFSKSFNYNLIMYNAIGEIVLNKFLCGDSEIDLSKFASGVYNLSIQSEKGTFNKKVIKH